MGQSKKKITITDAARLVLYQVLYLFRPKDLAETRALNLLFREFGLEQIEAIAGTKAGNERLAKYGKGESAISVSEAGAIHFRKFLDRITEVLTAGKTQDGAEYPAGLPAQWARALGPVIDKLDEAYPPSQPSASRPDADCAAPTAA